MAVISSNVEICNLALSHIDEGATVADIDTNPTTNAELECQKWYDTTRRGLLRKFVWNFARKRRTITLGGTPLFGFDDYYTLPNDFLRLLAFGNSGDTDVYYDWYQHRYRYQIEQKKILMNNDGTASLNVVYINDNIIVGEYDALFIETLALKLAYKMAYRFTTKKSVVERIALELEQKEQEAVAIDGQERPARRVEVSQFTSARRRRGSLSVASPYTVFKG